MLTLQIVCIQCFDAGLIGLVIIFTDIWNGIDYFAAFFPDGIVVLRIGVNACKQNIFV